MNIYGRDSLRWRKNKLCFRNKTKALFAVVEVNRTGDLGKLDEKYESVFWRVEWPDGTLSDDFYNKTRAKEHATRLALRKLNGGLDI